MSLIENIVKPELLAQSTYHVPDSTGMVKLDAMENPHLLTEALRVQLGEHLAQVALNRYPLPTYTELKQKMCREFGVPDGFQIMLGNGSDELISLMALACAKPGACIMAPVPTFVMFEMSAKLAGMAFVGVPLRADFGLDMAALLAAIKQHRPALLFVANPNNPTGAWYDEADLMQLLDAMSGIGLVIADEAYQPFAPGSMMQRLPDFPNLVVMRTTSKLGWAGLRLGYMSAAQPILDAFEKVRPPYNINVLTTAAATFLLDHMALFDEQATQIKQQRQVLINALRQFSQVEVFPTEANFVLIRVANAEQIFIKLLNHKILVKNLGKMHASLSNCLRVTVSTDLENQQFLDALADALK